MLLLLAQTINLIPDRTVIPQLLIFLAVVAVLTFFVFKPTLKIFDERRKKTSELQKETESLLAQTAAMDREYNGKMDAARVEGSKLERELIGVGEDEAREIVGRAREDSRRTISRAREEISADAARTKTELSANIDDFAKMIVAKVLDKDD